MTAAAQAARRDLDVLDRLLAAYLASRPGGYPSPSQNQSAKDFFASAFIQNAPIDGF